MEKFGRLMHGMKTMVVIMVNVVSMVNRFSGMVLRRFSLCRIRSRRRRSISGIRDGKGTEGDSQYDYGSQHFRILP
jgi:hypothetical protein